MVCRRRKVSHSMIKRRNKRVQNVVIPGVALFFLSSLNPAVVCEPDVTLPSVAPKFTGRYSGAAK